MPFDPKQLDDERLDALLREVTVPADLKDSLRQIPQSNDDADTAIDGKYASTINSSINDRSRTWMLVLAASLAAVAAFAGWQWYSGQNNSNEMALEMEHSNSIDDGTASGTASIQLAELDQEISTLTAVLDQLEIQRMKQRLAQSEARYETELANQEVQSIIIALADQVSLPLGGDSDSVKSDMAQVIKKYPGSMGAVIAREYLSHMNN